MNSFADNTGEDVGSRENYKMLSFYVVSKPKINTSIREGWFYFLEYLSPLYVLAVRVISSCGKYFKICFIIGAPLKCILLFRSHFCGKNQDILKVGNPYMEISLLKMFIGY